MADDKSVSEDQRADTTRMRGQVAAGMSDQSEKKKFIAAQGEGKMSDSELRADAYRQRNANATSDVTNDYATPRAARQ